MPKIWKVRNLNFKRERFPKTHPRSCEKFPQDPSTHQNPWKLPPETQNMATSLGAYLFSKLELPQVYEINITLSTYQNEILTEIHITLSK